MTNDSSRQRRPDRRYRRLFPAAVAAVTLAASGPFVTSAHADTGKLQPRREHVRPAPPRQDALLPSFRTTPDPRVQGNGATT